MNPLVNNIKTSIIIVYFQSKQEPLEATDIIYKEITKSQYDIVMLKKTPLTRNII